jgi:hypothetical protein
MAQALANSLSSLPREGVLRDNVSIVAKLQGGNLAMSAELIVEFCLCHIPHSNSAIGCPSDRGMGRPSVV